MRVFRHYVSPVKVLVASLDVVLLSLAIVAATWLRVQVGAGVALDWSLQAIFSAALFPVITSPILIGFGAYESDSLRSVRLFFVRMLLALVIAAIVLFAVNFLFPQAVLWRSVLLLAFVLGGAGLVLQRILLVSWLRTRRFDRRAVMVGAGEEAGSMLRRAEEMADGGIHVVAIVPDQGPETGNTQSAECDSVKALIDRRPIAEVVTAHQPEMIILSMERNASIPVEALLEGRLRGIRLLSRLGFYEEICGYVPLDEIGPGWMLFSDGFRGRALFERLGKRVLDIFVASSLLILVSPLMLVSALLVKLTSRGPVFYSQERVGLGGASFHVHKFRSMVADAEKATGATWAQDRDPRITPYGAFMRRTRIDELPQLLNILRGEMSFVGPRPERPVFVDDLTEKIPFYQVRHGVKPGLTGWAQIQFPYGASVEDAKRKLEYDLYYIKNYSLFLDVLIILQTARVVVFPTGVR